MTTTACNKQVDLKQANPLGAVTMATRNQLITGVFACWTLLWIAHVGLQINWINVRPVVFLRVSVLPVCFVFCFLFRS